MLSRKMKRIIPQTDVLKKLRFGGAARREHQFIFYCNPDKWNIEVTDGLQVVDLLPSGKGLV